MFWKANEKDVRHAFNALRSSSAQLSSAPNFLQDAYFWKFKPVQDETGAAGNLWMDRDGIKMDWSYSHFSGLFCERAYWEEVAAQRNRKIEWKSNLESERDIKGWDGFLQQDKQNFGSDKFFCK